MRDLISDVCATDSVNFAIPASSDLSHSHHLNLAVSHHSESANTENQTFIRCANLDAS